MALVRGVVNYLNVLDARRLNFIPKHFTTMLLNSDKFSTSKIDDWVYQNLDSRYAIVETLKVDHNNKLVKVYNIGVEDAKELTIFSLSCPYLDKNN